jgi:hypothetical protein
MKRLGWQPPRLAGAAGFAGLQLRGEPRFRANRWPLAGCGKDHGRRALKVDSSPLWKRISPSREPSSWSSATPSPWTGSISSEPSDVKSARPGHTSNQGWPVRRRRQTLRAYACRRRYRRAARDSGSRYPTVPSRRCATGRAEGPCGRASGGQQLGEADQVVGGGREGETPTDAVEATMPGLA